MFTGKTKVALLEQCSLSFKWKIGLFWLKYATQNTVTPLQIRVRRVRSSVRPPFYPPERISEVEEESKMRHSPT